VGDPAALVELALDEQRQDPREGDRDQVDGELRLGTDPLLTVSIGRSYADVGGGWDGRHRDQHPHQRARLGAGKGEHADHSGEVGDDDRERVGVGDEEGVGMLRCRESLRRQTDGVYQEGEQECPRDPERKADQQRQQ
jgi:hypothetical protein